MMRRQGRSSSAKKKAALAVLGILLAAALCGTAWILLRGGGQGKTDTAGTDQDGRQAEEEGRPAEEDDAAGEETEDQTPEEQLAARVQETQDGMTLEEKVNQLFMVTPEQLTGVGTAVQAGEATRAALEQHPVGGVIYFAQNLQSPDQTRQMLANTSQYGEEAAGFPIFLSVDEEGGQVSRIASNPAFQVPSFEYMSQVGQRGNTQEAYDIGSQIGAYLRDLGFNMDAAPDADVLTNPANEVVKYRSFGSDPRLVASMAEAELQGLREQGIIGMYKHFPGHGGTMADSHQGYAYVEENLEQLMSQALVPFQDGIDKGVQVIMVSHIACPNVTGDNTPATLSSVMITDVLRGQMGFDGMVMTDALNMGAITSQYSSADAAVKALQAGVDMLLMPEDFESAFQGVLQAVSDGRLTEERIDQSVERILRIKLSM